jgi:hypothetical protein
MSMYTHKTFPGTFSVSKQLLAAPGSYRFGGAHAQVAYAAGDGSQVEVVLHSTGVNVIEAAVDTVSVSFIGLNPTTPATFTDVTFVDVADSYTLAGDRYGVVLEGSFVVGDATLDANVDVYKLDPGAVLAGSGKIVVFGFSQS